MLSRLLEAHETILVDARDAAAKIAELGDDGSDELIVCEVIRTGELEARSTRRVVAQSNISPDDAPFPS
jgi:hypothetical protein